MKLKISKPRNITIKREKEDEGFELKMKDIFQRIIDRKLKRKGKKKGGKRLAIKMPDNVKTYDKNTTNRG